MKFKFYHFSKTIGNKKAYKSGTMNFIKHVVFNDMHKNLFDFNIHAHFRLKFLGLLCFNFYLCRWINCVQL